MRSPVLTTHPRRPRVACIGGIVLLGVLAFVSVMTTIIVTVGIWPGEAKLTAPLFCADDKPDAVVVVDSYSVQPGETSYNFSLYCMGSRGEVDEVGFFRPGVVLTLGHAALYVVLAVAAVLLHRIRRGRRTEEPAATGPIG